METQRATAARSIAMAYYYRYYHVSVNMLCLARLDSGDGAHFSVGENVYFSTTIAILQGKQEVFTLIQSFERM
jgi:hypothetical protein